MLSSACYCQGVAISPQKARQRRTWAYEDQKKIKRLSGGFSGDGFDCRLRRGLRTAGRIGGGNFTWTNFSYLVVNANSGHKEEIKEYITMLLNHDRQMYIKGVGFNVRRDVVRDSVVMVDGVPKKIGKYGLGSIQYLKPDGTTYLEEFLDFVDGCKAGGRWPSLIEQILEEDLMSYFKGGKSVREAAALVQNRVQLYLDEGR